MMAFFLSINKLEDLHQLFFQNGVFQKRCNALSLYLTILLRIIPTLFRTLFRDVSVPKKHTVLIVQKRGYLLFKKRINGYI
jgi:hypothetical protein